MFRLHKTKKKTLDLYFQPNIYRSMIGKEYKRDGHKIIYFVHLDFIYTLLRIKN